MAKPAKHALTILAAPELKVAKDDFKSLESSTVAQCAAVGTLENQAAVGAIIAGLNLHRVKGSLPHGKFDAWKIQKLTKINFWTEGTAKVTAHRWMRLGLAFVEKSRAEKVALLALPADGGALTLADNGAAKALAAKLKKFAGNLSLTELLIREGIMGVGLKSSLSDDDSGDGDDLTPAQQLKIARENAWNEAWTSLQAVRASLTEPEKMELLSDAKQIEKLKDELAEATKLANERLRALAK